MWSDVDIADVITSFVTNLTIRVVGASVVIKPPNIGQSSAERRLKVNNDMPIIWHFMVLALIPL